MKYIDTFETFNTKIVKTGTPGSYDKLYGNYVKAVQNTKRFNQGFVVSKTIKSANGEQTMFYHKATGKILLEWAVLCDRNGVELTYTVYKQNLKGS